jgi:hypothetical protein
MKVHRLILIALVISLIVIMNGCEYDGPIAMYDQEHPQSFTPVITQVIPDNGAIAGVNYITINGENFAEDQDYNNVFIDGAKTEIAKSSNTSITIRRPSQSGDSTTVKISVFGAVSIAEYKPYKIVPVFSAHGEFLSGNALGAVVVDDNENVYTIENSAARPVYKVTPDGEKTTIGTARGAVTSAVLSPEGNLIIFNTTKDIFQLDIVNNVDTVAVWASISKKVRWGDFDSFGNLYTSGIRKSDITVVKPDRSSRQLGLYPDDEIFWIQVYENFVYVFVELRKPDEQNPELAFWRHAILDGDGNLGDRELVLDWSKTGEYAELEPNNFSIGKDGNIYIATDHIHPILFFNLDNGNMDIIYKSILPSPAEKIAWGNSNHLYMILGADAWNITRIDMGLPENRDYDQ